MTILSEHCIIATSLPSAIPNDAIPETIPEEEADVSFESEPTAGDDSLLVEEAKVENEREGEQVNEKEAEENSSLPQPVLDQPTVEVDVSGESDEEVEEAAAEHEETEVAHADSSEEAGDNQDPPAAVPEHSDKVNRECYYL